MPQPFNLSASLNLLISEQSISRVKAQLANLGGRVDVDLNVRRTNVLAEVKDRLRDVQYAAKEAASTTDLLSQKFAQVGLRSVAFLTLGAALYGTVNALRAGVSEAVSFERGLVRLQAAGNSNISTVRAISNEVTTLSRAWGVGADNLLDSAIKLRQSGLSVADTTKLLNGVASGSLTAFGSTAHATDTAVSAMRAFRLSTDETSQALGTINNLVNQTGASADGIGHAIQGAGAAFKDAGGNLNSFLSILSSVHQRTGIGTEAIGTGILGLTEKLQRPETIQKLSQLGINGQGDTVTVLGRLANAYKDVPHDGDTRHAALAEELGFRRQERLLPALLAAAHAQDTLNGSMLSGTSITSQAAAQADTLGGRWQKLSQQFGDLSRAIYDSGLKTLLQDLTGAASAAVSVVSALRPALPLIAALATLSIAKRIPELGGSLLGRLGVSGPFSGFGGPTTLGIAKSIGPLVLAGGGALIGDYLRGRAGSADDAVRNNSTGRYTALSAAGAGLEGAALGGLAGFSVAGPLGAAVGAVVVGLTALTVSLYNSAKEIEEIRWGHFHRDVSGIFRGIASGQASPSSISAGSVFKNIQQVNDKARADSEGLFFHIDETEFKSRQRDALQGFVPGLRDILSRTARDQGEGRVQEGALRSGASGAAANTLAVALNQPEVLSIVVDEDFCQAAFSLTPST